MPGTAVDNPTNSGADAAYERALAAYREKSYEVARRWVLEALAHNRQHSAAKALLARLDAARRDASPFETPPIGSEVVSTDPTVLVSRAGGVAPSAEGIEPTVMLRRDNPPRRASDTDTHEPIRVPKGGWKQAVAEPTVIAQSKPRSSSSRPKSSFSLAGALQSLGGRSQGRADQSRAASSTRGRSTDATGPLLSTPAARGALLAVTTVAIGALLVWAAIGLFHWLFPAGHVLTITKPANGTIIGPGIECGTGGSDCSTTFRTAEVVELDVKPDKDYVFSGYTGDCAPAGRPMMTEPRTCSATFQPVVSSGAPVTFRLTIAKPEGGTIIAAGGIMCGTIGSTCSADIPSGQPVTLTAQADEGYVWEQFTGDCPAAGETIMTSAKTCTAVFAKTAVPIASRGPRPTVTVERRRPPVAPPVTNPTPGPTVAPVVSSAPFPSPAPSTSSPTSPLDKPAERPKTAEEHAKEEILQLVKNYCTELGTLKPERIRTLFHLDNTRELRDRFKEYKSLKCTVSSPPEYDRLDARDAGAAQLKFGMKQAVEMKSGGAPATLELNVTMVVSRKDFQSPWLIDRLLHEVKPKS
jgi:hypothetical protein